MLDFLIIVLVIYFIWKIIKPRFRRPPEQNEFKPKKPPASLNIDKNQIEDAKFKEIDDSDKKNNN